MLSQPLVVAALLAARSVVAIDLFAVDFPIVASVINSQGEATTYAVACPSGSDPKTCNFVQPYTLVQGPSTVSFEMTVPNQQTATLACTRPESDSLSCSATAITPGPAPSTAESDDDEDSEAETPDAITVTATSTVASNVQAFFKDVSIVTDSEALCTYAPEFDDSASPRGGNASDGDFDDLLDGLSHDDEEAEEKRKEEEEALAKEMEASVSAAVDQAAASSLPPGALTPEQEQAQKEAADAINGAEGARATGALQMGAVVVGGLLLTVMML